MMHSMRGQSGSKFTNDRNTLGVGGPAYQRLLEMLDENFGEDRPHPSRVYTRMMLAEPFVRVQIEHANTMTREMTLACRNLSRGGIGLLHSTFVYPDTRVVIHLTKTDGSVSPVRGKVVRCDHRGGVVHEVGVKFSKEIEPREFIGADITQLVPSFERVDLEKLKGNVLFVSETDQVKMVVREFLLETSLSFKFVANGAEALTELGLDRSDTANGRESGSTDEDAGDSPTPSTEPAESDTQNGPGMVIVDLELNDCAGTELVKKLRNKGVTCPMILIGDPGAGLNRAMVRVSGADGVLTTPLDGEALLRTLGEFMLSSWDSARLERIRSQVDRETVVNLCLELSKLGNKVDQQVKKNDPVAAFAVLTKVRALASLIGMNGLCSKADRLGESLSSGVEIDTLGELIAEVTEGCASAGRAAAA